MSFINKALIWKMYVHMYIYSHMYIYGPSKAKEFRKPKSNMILLHFDDLLNTG